MPLISTSLIICWTSSSDGLRPSDRTACPSWLVGIFPWFFKSNKLKASFTSIGMKQNGLFFKICVLLLFVCIQDRRWSLCMIMISDWLIFKTKKSSLKMTGSIEEFLVNFKLSVVTLWIYLKYKIHTVPVISLLSQKDLQKLKQCKNVSSSSPTK